MGNTHVSKMHATTLHASLQRYRSARSARSMRSMRRISLISTRARDSVVYVPPEKLPPNIEDLFEIDVIELKMQRNLCGCTQLLTRVDVVVDALDGRRPFVDRRIMLHAQAEDLRGVQHSLQIHSYLVRQGILFTPNQQQHPHLVTLHGHFQHQQTLHILTDYYPLGNLLAVLSPDSHGAVQGLPWFQTEAGIQKAVRELCAAVAFLDGEGIAHMDIALENIFVDSLGSIRLGDFRHAVYAGRLQRRRRVAPPPVRRAYAAPELYSGREVDLFKADAWSVGVAIVMLLTKRTPMDEATTKDTHYRLLQVLGVPAFLERMVNESDRPQDAALTPIVGELVQLLSMLLVCEPDRRLSVQEAIERFPWLRIEAAEPDELEQPQEPERPTAQDLVVTSVSAVGDSQ